MHRSRLKSAAGRSPQLAWLITAPVAALMVALLPLVLREPVPLKEFPLALLFLGLFVLAQATVLHFEVRRQSFTLGVTEIPLLVALFYLHPLWVIAARLFGLVIVQVAQRSAIVKLVFNVASVGLATTIATLIVAANPPNGTGPATWFVLAAAVFEVTLVSLVATIAVISLVQGFRHWPAWSAPPSSCWSSWPRASPLASSLMVVVVDLVSCSWSASAPSWS